MSKNGFSKEWGMPKISLLIFPKVMPLAVFGGLDQSSQYLLNPWALLVCIKLGHCLVVFPDLLDLIRIVTALLCVTLFCIFPKEGPRLLNSVSYGRNTGTGRTQFKKWLPEFRMAMLTFPSVYFEAKQGYLLRVSVTVGLNHFVHPVQITYLCVE